VEHRGSTPVEEAPLLMTAPLAVSALCAVVLCFAPDVLFHFFNLADLVVRTVF
jgi:hypothetical protein